MTSLDTVGILGKRVFAQYQSGCATRPTLLWVRIYATLAERSLPDLHTVTESPEQGDSDASTGEKYQLDAPEVVSSVNRCLLEIGETPLPSAFRSVKKFDHKMDRLAEAMKGLILEDTGPKMSDESEIILQLKEIQRYNQPK